jgi:hypothetical protein
LTFETENGTERKTVPFLSKGLWSVFGNAMKMRRSLIMTDSTILIENGRSDKL